MKLTVNNISTPVYLKTEKHMEWPKDKMFYILSANGLFLCRNHEWFRSCAPAKRGPGELEKQDPFCELNYPMIPKTIIEKAVGFFRAIEKKKGWESALILVWNRHTEQMELVCPDQKAGYGSVEYEIPKLPQHMALIGDIHAHPNFSPEPSFTDEKDEFKRPGLHIVAGYIGRKQPEFHCVAVVDGERFTVKDHSQIMGPFESSDEVDVPKEWLDKVKPLYSANGGYMSGGNYWSGSYDSNAEPDDKDKKAIAQAIGEFLKYKHRPSAEQVRSRLFAVTRKAGYNWCTGKAEEVLKLWDKANETGQLDLETKTTQ